MRTTRSTTLLLAACLTLTACFGGTLQTRGQTATPQANLMQECSRLPKLKPGENGVDNHIESARLYHVCSNRVKGWIDWYRSTEEEE